MPVVCTLLIMTGRASKPYKRRFLTRKRKRCDKKFGLEYGFNLFCEIDGFDPNLEGVECTFAEMTARSEKKQGILILKGYEENPAVEVVMESSLNKYTCTSA